MCNRPSSINPDDTADSNTATVTLPLQVFATAIESANGSRASAHQAITIQIDAIDTIADAQYTFSLNYAATPGALAANSKIGMYLDDKLIGHYAGTSSNSALNRQALSFTFKCDGLAHSLRVQVLEGQASAVLSQLEQPLHGKG